MIFLNKYKYLHSSKRCLFLFGALTFVFGMAACGLTAKSAITYHNLDYPSPTVEYSHPSPDTLMVYKFLSSASVDTFFMVISEEKTRESVVSQHRWQENPVDMITELVLRDIETSRLFERAVDQWSSMPYRYALEGTVQTLRGEVRGKEAFARVEADVSFIDFEASRLGKKIIFKKSYTIMEPSLSNAPSKIAEAMNTAVKKLSKSIRDDVSNSMKLINPAGN